MNEPTREEVIKQLSMWLHQHRRIKEASSIPPDAEHNCSILRAAINLLSYEMKIANIDKKLERKGQDWFSCPACRAVWVD